MHLIFKLSLLLICFVASRSEEEVLVCNLKYCGSELLNFEKFTFSKLFRKMELASFCVKNCTPAVVHEFFQSIIYGITQRIPGYCSGDACVDQNRFVALAKCVEQEAYHLLQCGKMLIDLAHIGLVENPEEEKRNTTCRIVTDTIQCIEERLQKCGDRPFQLVKEIMGNTIRAAVTTYCHPAYRREGWFLKRTTELTLPSGATLPPTEGPDYKHPQYVKGYNPDSAPGLQHLSYLCLLLSIVFSIALPVYHFH